MSAIRPAKVFGPLGIRCPKCYKRVPRLGIRSGDHFATCDAKVMGNGQNQSKPCGQKLYIVAAPGRRVAVVPVWVEEWQAIEGNESDDEVTRFLWQQGIIQAAYAALAREQAA